ncbi:short-chain dehydrogenase [Pseudomonas sp. PIC25]|uniref:SDR family NAD(P)-dependent oxidoreductase n=1 Tax=Pseudomonas sp. PIC25 TaxID=1958773 RepID=UPI000BAB71EB|nr:SDR family oxidoreductase [Pseudomonas sp. PIC25]PAU54945.1 short-chain dehydrogenase [Pseudomonas sp. PIC25]
MNQGADIFSLKGKVALITGATGYLGSAMAFVLAEAGATVLVNSRSTIRSNELVEEIRRSGFKADPAVFDVSDETAVKGFFEKNPDLSLDVLINNAYVGGAGSIELSDSSSYIKSYEVTLVAAHNMLRYSLPCLRRAVKNSGDVSVINIASMYALVSPDQGIYDSAQSVNPPFYGAAKAGLVQWSRYAACEFGHEGIRVNSISPGPFPSEKVQVENPPFIESLSKKVPLGRVGRSDEIKGPVLFLASSASSFVNGSNLTVDGGWTSW